jgi:hypothetical protein
MQTNIKRNWLKKTCGKITKFFKRIFFWKFLDWAGPGLAILVWASVSRPSEQWRTLHVHAKQWRMRLVKKKRRRKRSRPAMRCCRSRWRCYSGRQWFQAVVTPFFPCFCVASSFGFCSPASLFHLLFLTVVLLLLAVLLGSFSGCNKEEREVSWQ